MYSCFTPLRIRWPGQSFSLFFLLLFCILILFDCVCVCCGRRIEGQDMHDDSRLVPSLTYRNKERERLESAFHAATFSYFDSSRRRRRRRRKAQHMVTFIYNKIQSHPQKQQQQRTSYQQKHVVLLLAIVVVVVAVVISIVILVGLICVCLMVVWLWTLIRRSHYSPTGRPSVRQPIAIQSSK